MLIRKLFAWLFLAGLLFAAAAPADAGPFGAHVRGQVPTFPGWGTSGFNIGDLLELTP
jgi:hypothetical protein